MSIEYKKFTDESAKVAAKIALENRLYVSGWQLSGELKNIKKGASKYKTVLLAYKKDKPVSVVIVDNYGFAQAFTKKSLRKKGIASNLIKAGGVVIKSFDEGIEGSLVFWNKVMEGYV